MDFGKKAIREVCPASSRTPNISGILLEFCVCERHIDNYGQTVNLDTFHGWDEVRITANEDNLVASFGHCIREHRKRNPNICLLLFRDIVVANHMPAPRYGTGVFLVLKYSVIDLNERIRCESLQVGLLLGSVNSTDEGREILDPDDVVLMSEELKQSNKIEPLIRTSFQRSVKEVQAIDIDNG